MNRLDRRLTLLRAKRLGTFDRNQYVQEQADRARTARRVRTRLRRMSPVVLVTPRWSESHPFLDDIATDLLIGSPSVDCRTLNMGLLSGLTVHQSWAWLVAAITEFCGVHLEGPAWQAVSRHGFRHVMNQLMDAAQEGPPRCLMLHNLEHIPIEALEDLISVFDEYRGALDEPPEFNLLLAGSVRADHIQVDGAGAALFLPDFTAPEAVEALVERVGPLERHRLLSVIARIGGVPSVIEAVAAGGESVLSELVVDPDSIWRLLGRLANEIRSSFDLISANDELFARMELLAQSGPLPCDPILDPQLNLSGLTQRTPLRHGQRTTIRAAVFAELALSA